MRHMVGALVVLVLAGCSGGHKVDREAWEKDLAGIGVTVSDWAKYETTVKSVCDDEDPSTFLAVALDKGTPSMGEVRIGFKHECPDRMDRFEKALAQVTHK